MNPQQFVAKWGPGGPSFKLNERQGAQGHFMDLCSLLGVPTPGSTAGSNYIFEQDTLVLGAARGYADVFFRDHFAWENKAPGANLDLALKQLLGYSLALDNPPLLVVCDRLTIRIHTQFNGHPSEVHTVTLGELDQPEKQQLLRRLWKDPESFRPKKTTRDITELAAKSFATLAEGLRGRGNHPDQVAHFLTQCIFCFFAEDVDLLPEKMFAKLVNNPKLQSHELAKGLGQLFRVMRDGGLYGPDQIPWFNGGLFKKISIPELTVLDVTELRNAAALNWTSIDVSIFGTLFERGLDPAKRSQLGAHYTDPATIMRIVEPVVQRPLLETWAGVAASIGKHMAKSAKRNDKAHKDAQRAFVGWLDRLMAFRLLDPACGSGNFLFLGLKTLKDVEHRTHLEAVALGLEREQDLVTGPYNVLGIELNEFAAELARVTVWIGELQWRLQHGYAFKTNPVLEPLDHIECRDALIDADGTDCVWPKATVIIGNPPFIGDKKMRAELGGEYTERVRATFQGRLPGGSDFVCYWFEKAREMIAKGYTERAGLVATSSIRGGKNRAVLDRIVADMHIQDAWSDEPWVNNGAAVEVSLVSFGRDAAVIPCLNGQPVLAIASSLNATSADGGGVSSQEHPMPLPENEGCALQGPTKGGAFEVSGEVARSWLATPNPNGKSSADVLLPWYNGASITGRWKDEWIVDFTGLTEDEASMYEGPFAHVVRAVKPAKLAQARESRRRTWWLFNEPAPNLRAGAKGLKRILVTPEVAKHRVWAWLDTPVCADKNLVVVVRSDDATFGVLQSRMHSVWSLRFGTSLEDRPRYTSSSTFRTFPFPPGLSPRDTASQATETGPEGEILPAGLDPSLAAPAVKVARAACQLNVRRETWLNPSEWAEKVAAPIPLGKTASPYAGAWVSRLPGVNYSERRASIILSGAVEQDH